MTLKVLPVALLALTVAACDTPGRSRAPTGEPPTAAAPGGEGTTVEQARSTASGYSFLRPAANDSYEVLYFDQGGRASILRSEQYQIVHGRWTAEMAAVGSSTTPTAAICLSFDTPGGGPTRRCIDPTLLSQANTERAKGDALGIGRWTSVPETLPREKASFAELRARIKN